MPPLGLCPWTPLGDFRPTDPSCVPRSKFLATLLAAILAPIAIVELHDVIIARRQNAQTEH